MWATLRPAGKFLAAGEHSRFVQSSPVEKLGKTEYRVHPDPAELVTDSLLKDLAARGFLTDDDVALLKAWHPHRRDDNAVSPLPMGPRSPTSLGLPEDWRGPGSPIAGVLSAEPGYRNRTASRFPLRINVGYVWEETVDRQGNTWLPDQIFERGGYGYIGESQLYRPQQVLSSVDIRGTQDDEIYRTGRTQLTRFLITVPDGAYDVVLHFAHLLEGRLWHPAIDVAIEGKTVLQGFSAEDLERLHVATRRFQQITVADGLLDIDLTPSDLALCGIEVFHRG
jgi:hypothetical protein